MKEVVSFYVIAHTDHCAHTHTCSPVGATVSALRVGEVRLQEHVFVDSPHHAIHVGGHLLVALHQGQHDVQGLLSVAREVSPARRKHKEKHTQPHEFPEENT